MSRIVCAHVLRMRGRLEFLYPKPCLWNSAVWERCVQHHGLFYWVGGCFSSPPPFFFFFSRLGRNEYHGWEFKWQQTNQNISVYIDISLYIFFYIYEFHIQFLSIISSTAGSKAYDSGIVCKCKMRAESLLPHEEAEKLKLKQKKIKNKADRREEWQIKWQYPERDEQKESKQTCKKSRYHAQV